MDGITNGNWLWPVDWYVKYPILNMYTVPTLIPNTLDRMVCISSNGADNEFSVSTAWDTIRPRGDVVNWHALVWFSHAIPCHAFHLWLVIKRKLKTQDVLRQWDVWDHLKTYAGIPNAQANLDSIISLLIPLSKKRSARSVIAKLVFAASSYFIWQERNSKLFANQRRSKDHLIEVIDYDSSQVAYMPVDS
ncbi:reverse transcriptase domain, reverse transcriptase zinc-binding domain protein [Tanacetum coccineum]